jgi:hypothetical protein
MNILGSSAFGARRPVAMKRGCPKQALEINNYLCAARDPMPVCPKCHKLISANNYARHLGRCGTSHKHPPGTLEQSDFLMKI